MREKEKRGNRTHKVVHDLGTANKGARVKNRKKRKGNEKQKEKETGNGLLSHASVEQQGDEHAVPTATIYPHRHSVVPRVSPDRAARAP